MRAFDEGLPRTILGGVACWSTVDAAERLRMRRRWSPALTRRQLDLTKPNFTIELLTASVVLPQTMLGEYRSICYAGGDSGASHCGRQREIARP